MEQPAAVVEGTALMGSSAAKIAARHRVTSAVKAEAPVRLGKCVFDAALNAGVVLKPGAMLTHSTVSLTSSAVETSTTATVTADDEDEATEVFESMSESLQAAASTQPELGALTTETSSSTAYTPTPTPTETSTTSSFTPPDEDSPSTTEPEPTVPVPTTSSGVESLPGVLSTLGWPGLVFISVGASAFGMMILP
ncbi:hypothetical protein BDV12DRAFT_204413 [Aspergillus spectabilis]